MKRVVFSLNDHAGIPAAALDTSSSILKGYGAGTVTTPDKHRDFHAEDYLGFWTSAPETWKVSDIDLEVVIKRSCSSHDMAACLRYLAKTYRQGQTSGDVYSLGKKVGTWRKLT